MLDAKIVSEVTIVQVKVSDNLLHKSLLYRVIGIQASGLHVRILDITLVCFLVTILLTTVYLEIFVVCCLLRS